MKKKKKPAPAAPVSNETFKQEVIKAGNIRRACLKLGITAQAGYQRAKRLGMRVKISFKK